MKDLRSLELIEYANVVIDKNSMPFEREEKKLYDIIAQYEQVFKAVEDDGSSYDVTKPYWVEWHKVRDRIAKLNRKELVRLMAMWCSVRQGYDVIDICKSAF